MTAPDLPVLAGVARPGPSGDDRDAAAALTLHTPGLDGDEIRATLVAVVEEVGLGTAVRLAEERAADAGEVAVAVTAGGPTYGWLVFSPADETAERRAGVLAAHAAHALTASERHAVVSQRWGAIRHVAEQLQDALLPETPPVDHTSIVHRYRAAARDARVGGDFYDVFPLPDGRVLIVVGDVMGKGVEAASRTSRITQTLRALALQDLPLDELLRRADSQVTFQDPDVMATLWCGLYEPDSGELSFSSLGHPPALLLRGNDVEGAAIRLEMTGLPLGMRDLADEDPECRARRLEAGDLLVLYTDGVVEAAGDYLAGQDALLAAIEQRRDLPLDELADSALDELLAEIEHLDDALLLLLRRR